MDPSNFVRVEAEMSPGSIEQWLSFVKDGKKRKQWDQRSDLSMKVKKHLSALGWVFWYYQKGKRRELRYKSPKGKSFNSLATACMSCLHQDSHHQQQQQIIPICDFSCSPRNLSSESSFDVSNQKQRKNKKRGQDQNEEKGRKTASEEIKRPRVGKSQVMERKQQKNKCEEESLQLCIRDCGPYTNRDVCCVCHWDGELLLCDGCPSAFHYTCLGLSSLPEEEFWFCPCCCCDICGSMESPGNSNLMICVHQDAHQKQQQIVPKCDLSCSPRSVSSESSFDVSNPIQKKNKKRGRVDVSDQQKKNRRKTASEEIRKLRVGRSLKKILQGMEKKQQKNRCEKESLRLSIRDCGPVMNCDACCICHWGGELLLCDGCPSSFHYTCLGLSSLPEEDLWFCPCCCCDICGSVESPGKSKLMTCEQCRRRFHLKCLKEEPCIASCRGWFCSSQCNRVFSALQDLLGCKIAVGDDGDLVWTLMRAPSKDEHYDDEQISKLNSAVEILHQGFEPTKDPFSGRDLVEELIFGRDGTGVGRGFYTVLIERKNEPITVATVRVDKDVAEMPLVATSSSYRRGGMCRLLMDMLEKQMSLMGVCRVVLPAAEEVVTTWTQRFGFSVIESSEKLELLKHGMLGFAGTVMCHKFLLTERGDKIQQTSQVSQNE